jgi:hypothetical protein
MRTDGCINIVRWLDMASAANRMIHALICGVGLVLLAAGCASNRVIYDRRASVVPAIATGQESRVVCRGSIEVFRSHGMFHLIGPDGPWWSHKSFYGIYFRQSPQSPADFYLAVSPDRHPVRTLAVRGTVKVDGRHVIIDVEYEDGNGSWKRPPINGRRKIDSIFPDDLAQPKSEPVKE